MQHPKDDEPRHIASVALPSASVQLSTTQARFRGLARVDRAIANRDAKTKKGPAGPLMYRVSEKVNLVL